ncbi:hypothetical protein [Phenylobacterium sp.]|jgi:hypothetical protein
MGKWIAILLAIIVAAAVVGFMVDAVRVIAGFLVVVCLAVLAVKVFLKRG